MTLICLLTITFIILSNTITDISNSEIEFSKLPDIPNSLEVEQTEVLIKVKPK